MILTTARDCKVLALLMGHSLARYVRSLALLTPINRSALQRLLPSFMGSLTSFIPSWEECIRKNNKLLMNVFTL